MVTTTELTVPQIPTSPRYIKPATQSVREASAYLSVPLPVLYDLIALKEIVAVKRGGRTFVLTDSMDGYLDRLPRAVINLSKRGRERIEQAKARAAASLASEVETEDAA
jgi:excisionase family DNA binding protein